MMSQFLHLFGMRPSASSHGPALDDLLGYLHILMALLFIGWLVYFIMALTRFSKANNPRADYAGVKSHLSTWVEIGVAVIEAVLLIGFAIPLWANAVDHFPTKADNPVEINIMAQQFQWNAHYAGEDGKWGKQALALASATNPFGLDRNDASAKDDITCLREEFVVPVNRPVICRISSMDVIHSFKLPDMRVTQDAIPGMTIPVHFTPVKTGDYTITCAQLCGSLHSTMIGRYKVVAAEAYTKWFADKTKEAKAGGGAGFE